MSRVAGELRISVGRFKGRLREGPLSVFAQSRMSLTQLKEKSRESHTPERVSAHMPSLAFSVLVCIPSLYLGEGIHDQAFCRVLLCHVCRLRHPDICPGKTGAQTGANDSVARGHSATRSHGHGS